MAEIKTGIQLSWKYIAGFVDGEGYIGYIPCTNHYKNKDCVVIRNMINFGQKYENSYIIELISKKLTENNIRHCVTSDKYGKKRTRMRYIRITHRKAILIFLNKIIRYMIVKQDIAKQMEVNLSVKKVSKYGKKRKIA
jgi:hypothetical protein